MNVFTFLLVALAAGLARRRTRFGRGVVAASVAGLFLWSWDPFTTLLSRTLERGLPAGLPRESADAIVVLSGNFYPPDETQPEILPGYGTYLRCEHAALLHTRWKAVPVVATGGPVVAHGRTFDGTAAMRAVLEHEGVPGSMIWLENQSHTTHENAVHTAALLRAKGIGRIALVTEAFHMPRSLRAFRRQGLEVVPAPCAFRSSRGEGSWVEWLSFRPANMLVNEEAAHEWLGLLWYTATGRA